MLTTTQWLSGISSERGKDYLGWLYAGDYEAQAARYTAAVESFENLYGKKEAAIFSAPGRTEIGGNHTDHQNGTVLAAAVTMDMIAVASPREDGVINFVSHGFDTDVVDLAELSPVEGERGASASLIRGVCARMKQLGFEIGGFDAYQISSVLKGSGLSSSAAFEVLIGEIENGLYNGERASAPEIAQIGQYAENVYFGKPCGLMDQMASAVGGVVSIDFGVADAPLVDQVPCDLGEYGYRLCIVNAGGSHADLTDEYASIPAEMKQVAACFGRGHLAEVDEGKFYGGLGGLRGKVSDRALLRAIHFFTDNRYAKLERDALKNGDIGLFLRCINESGMSSFTSLQNCFPSLSISERSVALALVMSGRALGGRGAVRVHGGGFAGTVLAVVPSGDMDEYVAAMESIFGKGCCFPLSVRPAGGVMAKL
jgi:galactokinase